MLYVCTALLVSFPVGLYSTWLFKGYYGHCSCAYLYVIRYAFLAIAYLSHFYNIVRRPRYPSIWPEGFMYACYLIYCCLVAVYLFCPCQYSETFRTDFILVADVIISGFVASMVALFLLATVLATICTALRELIDPSPANGLVYDRMV